MLNEQLCGKIPGDDGVAQAHRKQNHSATVKFLAGADSLYNSAQSALLGGSGGMPPQKILDFRHSEIISGAVLGRNSSAINDPLPLAATAP